MFIAEKYIFIHKKHGGKTYFLCKSAMVGLRNRLDYDWKVDFSSGKGKNENGGKRMKRKKIRLVITAFIVLALAGILTACGMSEESGQIESSVENGIIEGAEQGETKTDSEAEEQREGQTINTEDTLEDNKEQEVTYTGKLIEKNEESYLIASDGTEGVLEVRVAESNFMENGNSLKKDEIVPGMVVEVTFNGIVLESYPGQIYASKIEVISREDDMVSLYLDILKQIYENDEGLNGDISMIAVDISKADNLSKGEKEAILYKAWLLFGMEVIPGTFEELKEQGYIYTDEDNFSSFPKGVLLEIETVEVEKDSFRFEASKWRSGLGADFYTDCRVWKENGKYMFEMGGCAVS